MQVRKFLSTLNFMPNKEEIKNLKKEAVDFSSLLEKEVKKKKISAEVFVGGSLAKGTIVKKILYDIDIFVRFDWRYENISSLLERTIKEVCKKNKLKYTKVHGSRDYFRIRKNKIIFEIIPVIKIKNPKEARNVTDLSYFHVSYIKNKLRNTLLGKEIVLAKTFCRACGVYGAESYIQGFSGYGLECLIIYYKSFEKMLRELSRIKERIVIDSEKKFKNKDEIFITLNESKLQSPIVLIDPTWKERNVLAAISHETFVKFQECTKNFLKNPKLEFFEEKKFNEEKFKNETKKKKAEFVHLIFHTDRQPGDIAGTKLKKFSKFLVSEMEKYFHTQKYEFIYDEKNKADFYIAVKSKEEIIRIGPPNNMKKNIIEFKKSNKNVFEKNGFLHSRIKIDFSAKEFLAKFKRENQKKIREMSILDVKIV